MKILSLPKYSYQGPSSRYRFYNYQECFEAHGFNVRINPFLSNRYFQEASQIEKLLDIVWAYLRRIILLLKLLILPKQYDVILVEYELIPYFPALFEKLLKLRGFKYIVDYDDPLFHRYDIHSNFVIRFLFKNKIAKVMRHAEKVIVCNDYLGAYAKIQNKNLITLPTVVKLLDKYISAAEEVNQCSEDTSVIIGWIGSRSTSKFIVDILPALERLARSHDVVYRLVGFDGNLLSEEAKQKTKITTVKWSEEEEISQIANMDIGIMPLSDNPWTRGKCGFKLLQYMSCAKAVVASPVGINTTIVGEENGFLAEDIDTWYEKLKILTEDASLRTAMGKKGLEKVKAYYYYPNNCTQYVTAIKSMMER